MLCCYLRPTIGYTGVNKERLAAIGGFLMALLGGWILYGDFNLTPSELEASGWLTMVGGVIILAEDLSYTCRAGSGRVIDYIVCSESVVHRVISLRWEPRVTWTSHRAFKLEFNTSKLSVSGPQLALPGRFPSMQPTQAGMLLVPPVRLLDIAANLVPMPIEAREHRSKNLIT